MKGDLHDSEEFKKLGMLVIYLVVSEFLRDSRYFSSTLKIIIFEAVLSFEEFDLSIVPLYTSKSSTMICNEEHSVCQF